MREDIDSFKNKLEKRRTCHVDFFKDIVYKFYRLHELRSRNEAFGDGDEKEKDKERLCQVQPRPVSYRHNIINHEYKHSLAFRVQRYVAKATKPVYRLQIRPIVHI